ncbi:MAG: tRNA (N6-isopentenyl adenosine(37)-C2)-methylthiotransferase MiaB [Acidimicrobiia bacterium]|nr:tRNA (N6-isopentenyl adenosine(37)-C2)-methylthiotransferase MiaB [Acidimicrobiia bacterium]MYC58173.1 tRNA (N6-isopentenyl adenosine(37)-C2)-methylthiotransferase MiaB [Acidimicrobiia bacterium]MYI30605.1 tRNA (N6-isopentenyl adenosine(37)-C2)-methylthiotransferase MiaB [Acidimicrobiia bacterium]
MSRSYFIRTYGCQMNEHDTERIAGLLEADGMVLADDMESADTIVLNTCCIRENADNKLYGQLGHLKQVKQARPDLQIAVAGCLAQKDRDLIRERAAHVDVVFGTHNVHRAAELIGLAVHSPVVEILEQAVEDDHNSFPSALPVRREAPYAAWMTIQVGCDNSCAFCIVPAVRGAEISQPISKLLDEAAQLAASGVTEITLLGQNVNSYGRDLQRQRRQNGDKVALRPLFDELLRKIGAIEGIKRLRFTSPHPKDLRPETIDAMTQVPAVCEHLHLPLQSGSDKVLAAMHRGYTAERYLERLQAARRAVEDLAVSTDIIVGFPGETEKDFEQTLQVAAEARYDSAFTFVFSPRSGTEAAEMVDRYCCPAEVNDRFERLRVVVEHSSRQANQARIGMREEVVVEGKSKKNADLQTGRTRQNRLVHFATSQHLRPGTFATVDVTEAGAHHLKGDLVEVTAPARWRAKIPVAAS